MDRNKKIWQWHVLWNSMRWMVSRKNGKEMTMTGGMKRHAMEAVRDALSEGRPFNMNCCACVFLSSGPLCSSTEATIRNHYDEKWQLNEMKYSRLILEFLTIMPKFYCILLLGQIARRLHVEFTAANENESDIRPRKRYLSRAVVRWRIWSWSEFLSNAELHKCMCRSSLS